jgi:hypothetical protein
VITITSQAIEKFLVDSRKYLAHDNPHFKRVAGPLPPASVRHRREAANQKRWEIRSSL